MAGFIRTVIGGIVQLVVLDPVVTAVPPSSAAAILLLYYGHMAYGTGRQDVFPRCDRWYSLDSATCRGIVLWSGTACGRTCAIWVGLDLRIHPRRSEDIGGAAPAATAASVVL
mmetsp:Transcript_21794/g.47577  ORF Transcript_21794/g.47577 Transcript_21794/m.47577 type:complete len:113 (-) Transcript_21794:258-596(-)